MSRLSRRGPIASSGVQAPFDLLASISWTHAYWTEGPVFVASSPVDGAALGTWQDEVSTGAVNLTSSGTQRPFYLATDVTMTKPIVQFSAGDDRMVADFTDLTQPNEVVVIGRSRSASSNAYIVDGVVSTGRHAILIDPSFGRWAYDLGNGWNSGGTSANTTKHLWRLVADGTSSALFVDEVSVASGDAGAHAMSGFTVGNRYDDLAGGSVDLCFVGVCDTPLTSSQRASLHTWAQGHYGTA